MAAGDPHITCVHSSGRRCELCLNELDGVGSLREAESTASSLGAMGEAT